MVDLYDLFKNEINDIESLESSYQLSLFSSDVSLLKVKLYI